MPIELTQEQAQELLDTIREHETAQGNGRFIVPLPERLRGILNTYQNASVEAIRSCKEFRDRLLIDLRAISMVLQMVGNADTHREKNARLRGSIELLESAITRLEREQFDTAVRYPSFTDPFRSDYPTRHLVDRIHTLENELKEAKDVVAKQSMPSTPPCDHQCHCGTATSTPHNVGENGCLRILTPAPVPRADNRWFVDGSEITDFTLRQQRGYYQHPCGCWSRCPGSENSISA